MSPTTLYVADVDTTLDETFSGRYGCAGFTFLCTGPLHAATYVREHLDNWYGGDRPARTLRVHPATEEDLINFLGLALAYGGDPESIKAALASQ